MLSTTRKSPFPWLPMMAISIGLVSNSYAQRNLFPYIGYMVQYLGVTDDKDEAGFYAGYVSSALMVGRFGSSYFWGRFADRYGRLPVMYISLCSMVVLSIAFGMSTSFYWAVSCRFILGAMNGIVVTSKTMISEVCTKEHEVVGMSIMTASMSLGLVGGPGIGGLLSEPAKHYPTVFSESGLFGRFPYLLPNLVGACIALAGLPMVFFFLHETKPTQAGNGSGDSVCFEPLSMPEIYIEDPDDVDKAMEMTPRVQANTLDNDLENDKVNISSVAKSMSTPRSSGRSTLDDDIDNRRVAADTFRLLKEAERVLDSSGSETRDVALQDNDREAHHGGNICGAVEAEGEAGRGYVRRACWTECLVPMRLLTEREVRGIIFSYGLISFIKIGFDEVYPLWALSTITNGGLDWTTLEIGKCLSITGIALLVFQMVIYPPLIKMVDIQLSQRVMSFLMIPFFIVTPLLSLLHGKGWVLTAANLVVLFFINIAANTILINISLATNNAVDPSHRGTLNGISMATGSLAKAAGPPFFAVVFACSISYPHPFPFDYHLVFNLMTMLMAVLVWASWDVIRIPEAREDSIEEDGVTVASDKETGVELTSHRE